MKKIFLFISIILLHFTTFSQNQGPSVGKWKSYLSYNTGTDCDYSEDYIYVGTHTGFFTFDLNDEVLRAYSKVDGMNGVDITNVHFNKGTRKTIIGYLNGNIDVFLDGKFENIPDFMISGLPGEKRIYDITSQGNLAYASTSMGLVVIDLEKLEIDGTTQFYDGTVKAEVFSSTILNDTIFVTTNVGVYKTNIHQPFFQDYRSWVKISNEQYRKIIHTTNRLFVWKDNELVDSVFRLHQDGALDFIFASSINIGTIDADSNDGIFIATDYSASGAGELVGVNKDGVINKISECYSPKKVIRPISTQIYFADETESSEYGGLRKVISTSATSSVNPNGPESRFVYDISAKNGEIWIAHGRYKMLNWQFMGSRSYFSSYVNNTWKNYRNEIYGNGWYDYLLDASRILKDYNTGKVYIGFANGGLVEMDKENNMTLYRNAVLDGAFGDTTMYIISGMALDAQGNLWMTNYAGSSELKMKNPKGEFYTFHSSLNPNRLAVDLVIDDYGSKWYYSTFDGGLYVYNEKNTPENPSDDLTNSFKTGRDFGNLPSNTVQCIAKDRSNTIWVGTNNGIAIFNAPKDALEGTGMDTAELRIVKYDGDFDYKLLFNKQSVTAIAVDGDNRKWIGTSNNGVYLISNDARELIYHFTTDNSPLLSDEIIRIAIDDKTGDVYFATGNGLIAYRGTSTAPQADVSEELIVYPNPVPSNYDGYISIKDLKTRCEVKITDINGYLITQFETNGGQAVWDGKDYNGRRPQSGVYLIFITDRMTGKMIKSGKLIFEH